MHHQDCLAIFVLMISILCPGNSADTTTTCERHYKVDNSTDELECAIDLRPNDLYSFTVDIKDIYDLAKMPLIPVIKTSASQIEKSGKEIHGIASK